MTTLRNDPIRAPRTPVNTYRAGVRAFSSSGVTTELSASRAGQDTDLIVLVEVLDVLGRAYVQ
jgi:hypothetical protein